MSLLSKFIQAVQSWRRRGESKSRKRAEPNLEQLDHRQLLAVTFTGNVRADFPVTNTTGVVDIEDTGNLNPPPTYVVLGRQHNPTAPTMPVNIQQYTPTLQQVIQVSGLNINGLRVSYDPAADTLDVGILQPLNPKPVGPYQPLQYPVIAGDTDNSGSNVTPDPTALEYVPGIAQSKPFLTSNDTQLAVYIDLGGQNLSDQFIVAGIPSTEQGVLPGQTKHLDVADAVFGVPQPVQAPVGAPDFGQERKSFEGAFFVGSNDPAHGAMEIQIKDFSALYQLKTGRALTPTSVIRVGGFGSSTNDGQGEANFPPQPLLISNASPPVPPIPPVIPGCPPVSPPVAINPHAFDHINTAHNNLIRVTVFGTSGFDPRQIVPSTVRLGGATPVSEFTRDVNHDGLPDETFIFKGLDITLPPGITEATVTGSTISGQMFSTSQLVFNRNDSFYTEQQIIARDLKLGIQTTLPATYNRLSKPFVYNTLAVAAAQAQAAELAAIQLTQEVANGTYNPATATASQAALFNQLTAMSLGLGSTSSAATQVTPQVPIGSTITPATVAIPTRAEQAKAASRTKYTPTMSSATSFLTPATPKATAAASSSTAAAQALMAKDAALASYYSANTPAAQTAG